MKKLWKTSAETFQLSCFLQGPITSTQQANESLLATLSEAFLTDELEDAYDP